MTLVLHIGLPKTASTHLQKMVFPAMLADNRYAFGERAKQILRSGPAAAKPFTLLSAEAWSNSLCAGGYEGNFRRFLSSVERLGRDDIKILFFIRDHREWLVSAYLQLNKAALNKPPRFSEFIAAFDEEDISWSRRVVDLEEYPTLVCSYEEFANEPEKVCDRVARFIGAEGYHKNLREGDRSRLNRTPGTPLGLNVVRAVTIGTELPDLAFRKMLGRRLLFGRNGKLDFWRVGLRDRLIGVADSIPGQRNLKNVLFEEIPPRMGEFFAEDMEKCFRNTWQG